MEKILYSCPMVTLFFMLLMFVGWYQPLGRIWYCPPRALWSQLPVSWTLAEDMRLEGHLLLTARMSLLSPNTKPRFLGAVPGASCSGLTAGEESWPSGTHICTAGQSARGYLAPEGQGPAPVEGWWWTDGRRGLCLGASRRRGPLVTSPSSGWRSRGSGFAGPGRVLARWAVPWLECKWHKSSSFYSKGIIYDVDRGPGL